MLKDIVSKYYLEENYNCCESILHGANDYYELRLHDHDMRMAAGFGAGIQCGDFCGALSACVMVLSLKYVKRCAHEAETIKLVTNQMIDAFENTLKERHCISLKEMYFKEDVRCLQTVTTACDLLEEVIHNFDQEELF